MGLFYLIRRLLGFAVILVSLLLALFAVVGWSTGKDNSLERGTAIGVGVVAVVLLLIGSKMVRATRRPVSWRSDPATERQRSFANDLGIQYPKNITKGELSDLIGQETGDWDDDDEEEDT